MTHKEKIRETRIRRMAIRQGLILQRSRARDPNALTYGGYQLVDLETGGLVFGLGAAQRGFGATLDEIEDALKTPGGGARRSLKEAR